MFQSLKQLSNTPSFHRSVVAAKKALVSRSRRAYPIWTAKAPVCSGQQACQVEIRQFACNGKNDVTQIIFFLERVKPGDFVLDIGGHFRQYAVLLGSLVSDSGRVISFEPLDPSMRIQDGAFYGAVIIH